MEPSDILLPFIVRWPQTASLCLFLKLWGAFHSLQEQVTPRPACLPPFLPWASSEKVLQMIVLMLSILSATERLTGLSVSAAFRREGSRGAGVTSSFGHWEEAQMLICSSRVSQSSLLRRLEKPGLKAPSPTWGESPTASEAGGPESPCSLLRKIYPLSDVSFLRFSLSKTKQTFAFL